MPLYSSLRRLAQLSPLWLTLALLSGLFVGYKSLVPTVSIPQITHFDKLLHFVAYFGLAFIFTMGAARRIKPLFICLLVIAYGSLIEVLQYFMALGRSGSVLDGVANGVGAIVGTALASYLIKQWFFQTDVRK